MAAKEKSSLLEKLVPVILLASIALAFMVGVLWQKVNNLSGGGGQAANTATQKGQDAAQQQPQQTQASFEQIKALFDEDIIQFGDKNSKLLIAMVSDVSCPYCHVASGLNPNLNKQAGEQFTLVSDGGDYVAPLPEIRKLIDDGSAAFVYLYSNGHGNGELAAQALYCAYERGRFWQVHDLLMTEEGYDLVNEDVENDVENASLLSEFLKSAIDEEFMTACLESGKYVERVTADMTLASSIGINGTPGFYFNETAFRGAYSYSDMETVVSDILSN